MESAFSKPQAAAIVLGSARAAGRARTREQVVEGPARDVRDALCAGEVGVGGAYEAAAALPVVVVAVDVRVGRGDACPRQRRAVEGARALVRVRVRVRVRIRIRDNPNPNPNPNLTSAASGCRACSGARHVCRQSMSDVERTSLGLGLGLGSGFGFEFGFGFGL